MNEQFKQADVSNTFINSGIKDGDGAFTREKWRNMGKQFAANGYEDFLVDLLAMENVLFGPEDKSLPSN